MNIIVVGAHPAEAYHLAVSTPEAEGLFSIRTALPTSGSRTTRRSKHQMMPLYEDQPFTSEEQ